MVERLPVAAAQWADRRGAAGKSRHPGRRRQSQGRAGECPRPARHVVSHDTGRRWRIAEPDTQQPVARARFRRPDLRPVHCRPHDHLHAGPVGRHPPPDRIAGRSGRSAVLPARGRLSVAQFQRRGRRRSGSGVAGADRRHRAHHRSPARHARHPAASIRAGREFPAAMSRPSRPPSPRPRPHCRRCRRHWRSNATFSPR